MNFPEDPFFQSLIARLIQPGVIGISVGGSHARGEQKKHSDVNTPAYRTRGMAALDLYKETAAIFKDILTEKTQRGDRQYATINRTGTTP